jgi:hypothetical protein
MSFTSDLSDGFFDTLKDICTRLGCEPIDLLSVMMSESEVRATAHNPNGDASGLIQFMPNILVGLGWTNGPGAFRQLSAEEQLPFVEKFFSPFASKGLSPAARLYQATFLPATLDLGSDPDTVICQQGGIHSFAYAPNRGFDQNDDGMITVGELQTFIDRRTQGPRWKEMVSRLNGTPIDETIDLQTVEGVQRALLALGFDPGTVDGINGPHTREAVKAFQDSVGLTADGVVGPQTRAALASALDDAGIPHTD